MSVRSYLVGLALIASCSIFGEAVGCAEHEAKQADPTGDLIRKCTAEARAEHYVGQKSVSEALRHYDACVADGGK